MSIDYQIKYKNMANGRHEFQRWEKISEEKAMGMVKRHFGQLAAKNINDMQYHGSVLELPLCWIRARVEQSPFMSFNRGTDVEVWDGPRLVNPHLMDKAKGKDHTVISFHGSVRLRRRDITSCSSPRHGKKRVSVGGPFVC